MHFGENFSKDAENERFLQTKGGLAAAGLHAAGGSFRLAF